MASLPTLTTNERNSPERPTLSGAWGCLTHSPCVIGVLAQSLVLNDLVSYPLHFVYFTCFPWFSLSSGFPNRLGGDSKFCFLFFSLRHFYISFSRDSRIGPSSCLVAWLQKLATPLGITKLQLSFSLFCLVVFFCLHDCLHVFALLACFVIHALISCFMPCLYAYFTHACRATICHSMLYMPFGCIECFLFHNPCYNTSTCHIHAF